MKTYQLVSPDGVVATRDLPNLEAAYTWGDEYRAEAEEDGEPLPDDCFIREVRADDQLMIDYADLGVTTGYIGNFERWGDDRSFKVFVKASSKPSATACDQSIHIKDARSLAEGEVVVFDTPEVRAQLDRIRERLARGEVFRVGEARWLVPALADAARGIVPQYHVYNA